MTSKEALEILTSEPYTSRSTILIDRAIHCKFAILKDLERLERLEEKETPKKPIYDSCGKYKKYKYLCPNDNCRQFLFNANSQTMRYMKNEKRYKHCAFCGQKLDWS